MTGLFLGRLRPNVIGREAKISKVLLYANCHNVCCVGEFHRNMDWHFLRLLFIFIFSQRHAILHYVNAGCEHHQLPHQLAF